MAGFTLPEETPESQLGPSTASILRTRDIPWDIYMTARLISDKDLQLLRRYDNKNPGTQARLLAENGAACFATFLTVLKNVTKDETVQYALALLDDALSADPRRAALVWAAAAL
ncbi:hypothetical protein H632_c2410p0, partial [Helicosporidium sp. ATCC 50920]